MSDDSWFKPKGLNDIAGIYIEEVTMALTKDKLVANLQTQIGMTKLESRQIVERLFEIMKGTLSDGENLLINGFGTFLVRQKNARRGEEPSDQRSSNAEGSEGVGVQDVEGVERKDASVIRNSTSLV